MAPALTDAQIRAQVQDRLALYEQETRLSPRERESFAAKLTALAIEARDKEAAERRREAQEESARRQREAELIGKRAKEWFLDEPKAVAVLKRKILRHLKQPEGRDGPLVDHVSDILSTEDNSVGWRNVRLCVDALKQARAIKETEDGRLYTYSEWYRQHPERRGAVEHIGTVPQAVLDHPECKGGRLKIAHAISGHFYRNRTAHAKARAIGIRELAKDAGVNPSTAMDTVKWLRKAGLLERVARGAGRRGAQYRWSAETKAYKPKRKQRKVIS
jgi:Fe2+ or Zn2+ uptake regulation protein